jgi:hypothetical protein
MAVSVVASVCRGGSVDGGDTSTPRSGAGDTVTFSATPGSISGFGRSASIQRRESLLRKRIPNKTSPFVGTFRHAPPSSSSICTSSAPPPVFQNVLSRGNTPPQIKPARPNSLAEAKELFRPMSSAYGPSSLYMEASPYVGMFRHAPSTSLGNLMKKRQCSNSSLRDMIDSAFTNCGAFGASDSKKHIKLSTSGGDEENVTVIYVDGRLPGGQPLPDRRIARGSAENSATNQATFPPLTFLDQRISSSLQSGLKSTSNASCTSNTCTSGREFNDAASYSTSTSAFAGNVNTPSATLGILDRLVHWLLFPMTNSTVPGAGLALSAYDHQGGGGYGILNAILPYFHSFIKNILLLENGTAEEVRETNVPADCQQKDEGSVSSSESYGDESSSIVSSDASNASGLVSPLASSPQDHAAGGLAQLLALDVSVSSLAERYYAHEAFKELVGSSSSSSGASSPSSPGTFGLGSNNNTAPSANAPLSSSPESLDYVITQIDIARMVRNASRHLDVESILSLPTVTYKSNEKQSEGDRDEAYSNDQGDQDQATSVEDTNDEDLNWSWMMIGEMDGLGECQPPSPEAPGQSKSEEENSSENEINASAEEGQLISDIDEDTCVICLEHFIDGDRLRVLPCDHSFHVGCIDKWLSGSSSNEECFTSGCPTCKKHPVPIIYEEEEAGSTSNDGSVPRWAFARLGGVLANS